jgi:hypothetical protein
MNEVKSPFKSKTIWVNVIVAALAFFPVLSDKVSPEFVTIGLGFVNVLLRLITKDKIGLE